MVCFSHWATCTGGWMYLLCEGLNGQCWSKRWMKWVTFKGEWSGWLLKPLHCVLRAMLLCGFLCYSILFRRYLGKHNCWQCCLGVERPTKGVRIQGWKMQTNGGYSKGIVLPFVSSFFCKPCRSCSLPGDSCWDRMDADEADLVVTEVQLDPNLLPLVNGENDDQVLRFYWLDAYEDQYSQPGNWLVKARRCHSDSFLM